VVRYGGKPVFTVVGLHAYLAGDVTATSGYCQSIGSQKQLLLVLLGDLNMVIVGSVYPLHATPGACIRLRGMQQSTYMKSYVLRESHVTKAWETAKGIETQPRLRIGNLETIIQYDSDSSTV